MAVENVLDPRCKGAAKKPAGIQTTLPAFFPQNANRVSGGRGSGGGHSRRGFEDDQDDDEPDVPQFHHQPSPILPTSTPRGKKGVKRPAPGASDSDDDQKDDSTLSRDPPTDNSPRALGLAIGARNYAVSAALFVKPTRNPRSDKHAPVSTVDYLVLDTRERKLPGADKSQSCRVLIPVQRMLKYELPKIPTGMIDATLRFGHHHWRAAILTDAPATALGGILARLGSAEFAAKLKTTTQAGGELKSTPSRDLCPDTGDSDTDPRCPDVWFMLKCDANDKATNPKPNAQSNKEPRCGHADCADSDTKKKQCPSAALRDAAGFFDDKPDPVHRAFYNPYLNRIRVAVLRNKATPLKLAWLGSAAIEFIEIDLTVFGHTEGGGVQLRPLMKRLCNFRVEALVALKAPPPPADGDRFIGETPKPESPFDEANLSKSLPGYVFEEVTLREILPPLTDGLMGCGMFRPQLEILFKPHHYGKALTGRFGESPFFEHTLVTGLELEYKMVSGRWNTWGLGDTSDIPEEQGEGHSVDYSKFYFPWIGDGKGTRIKAQDPPWFIERYNAQIKLYPVACTGVKRKQVLPAAPVLPAELPAPARKPKTTGRQLHVLITHAQVAAYPDDDEEDEDNAKPKTSLRLQVHLHSDR